MQHIYLHLIICHLIKYSMLASWKLEWQWGVLMMTFPGSVASVSHFNPGHQTSAPFVSLSRFWCPSVWSHLNRDVYHLINLVGVLSAHSSPWPSWSPTFTQVALLGHQWLMGSNNRTENNLFLISLWSVTRKISIAICIGNAFLMIFLHGFSYRKSEHPGGCQKECLEGSRWEKARTTQWIGWQKVLWNFICSRFDNCSSFSFP